MVDHWRQEDHSSSDPPPLNIPPRRSSESTIQSSSTGRPYQGGSGRNSERRRVYEEHSKELKQQLLATKKQLKIQELRTAEAERELLQLANHLKRVNDARLAALQEATKASEELKLYKIQLQHAQQEVFRAQDTLNDVDKQRYDAEREAAQARTMARKLNQTMMVQAAMEEGRRVGLREGLERGRNLGLQEAQIMADFGDEERYDENDYLDDVEYRPRSLFIGPSEDIQPTRSPPPAPPPDSIPVLPPQVVQPVPDKRPRSVRNSSPSAPHTHVSIPPEGYIPALGADHVIRIPPPHELSRPPPTPERVASPPLPQTPQQEPLPIPRHSRRGHQRNSSLGSISTSLSQLEMVNGPEYISGRQSPLSVIPEVRSVHSSPNRQSVGGHDLRHQPSWGGSSHHSDGMGPGDTRAASSEGKEDPYQPTRSMHRCLSTSSNASRSLRPPSAAQEDRRKSSSSASSVPGIKVLPPSRPTSFGTPQSQDTAREHNVSSTGVTYSPKPLSILLQPSDGPSSLGQQLPPRPFYGGSSPDATQTALPISVPMPGAYQEQTGQTPKSFTRKRQDVAHNGHDSDDDFISDDTLTTPVLGRHSRHKHAPSVDAFMTPQSRDSRRESGWEAAVRLAGSPVPIPFDNKPPLARSN